MRPPWIGAARAIGLLALVLLAQHVAIKKSDENGHIRSSPKTQPAPALPKVSTSSSIDTTVPSTSAYDPRTCGTHTLVHNTTAESQGAKYHRVGPPLVLVDVFTSISRCSEPNENQTKKPNSPCPPVLATFIFNVKVFEFELQDGEPIKLRGAALQRGRREQQRVYKDLTSIKTLWKCTWTAKDAEITDHLVVAENIVKDGHGHSLVVQCRVPPALLTMPVRHDQQLNAIVGLTATNKGLVKFGLSGVSVCAKSRSPRVLSPMELAACTMVSEISPMFNAAALTRQWVNWHLWNGVTHVTIYLDASNRSTSATPTLEIEVKSALRDLVNAGIVDIIFMHQLKRGSFETQQAMETHCLWRYKGVAKWVLHDDIDEYIQPLGTFQTILEAVRMLSSQHQDISALQVPQSFWGHLAHEKIDASSLNVSNMTWRSSGPFKRGREKLIISTERTSYVSVHTVSTGPPMYRTNPETELRMNHFRRHFSGLGSESQTPTWANKGIGPRPLRDMSFQQLWKHLAERKPRDSDRVN